MQALHLNVVELYIRMTATSFSQKCWNITAKMFEFCLPWC